MCVCVLGVCVCGTPFVCVWGGFARMCGVCVCVLCVRYHDIFSTNHNKMLRWHSALTGWVGGLAVDGKDSCGVWKRCRYTFVFDIYS